MNIALIIAGGVGARMHQDIPKQFINVYDKPVIIYTLEAFQKHPNIDAIEVVCQPMDAYPAMAEALRAQANPEAAVKSDQKASFPLGSHCCFRDAENYKKTFE